MLQKLNRINPKTLPLHEITLEQLRDIFQNHDNYHNLFLPHDVVIVENQTYQLGYPENANLILKDGLTDVYAAKDDDKVSSLSFNTPIPSGNTMNILRVGIEYYGPEDTGIMFKHFHKHFMDIPECLKRYPLVDAVSVHFFMYKALCTDYVLAYFKDLATKLKFNAWQINYQAYGLIDHDAEVRARTDEDRIQRAKKHKASL